MGIKKAYKFKLKPSAEQEKQMHDIAGHCRFLWNKVLRINLERLKNRQPLMWYNEADFWCKLWKNSEEYGFLKDAPAHCLQHKLKDLNKAFRDGFDKKQILKRLPRTKKKWLNDSFRFPEAKHIKLDNRRIKLPKLGWMGFHKSRSIDGVIKNATISRSAGSWYISIQVEIEQDIPKHHNTNILGVDLGVSKFLATSEGYCEGSINPYRLIESKLQKHQRILSKKKRYSSNWKKQQRRLQKCHAKIASIRKDFQHKLSTILSKNHATIVVEDLKIKNVSASAKGTLENPGKGVAAKSGLNKSILDQGWGEFIRQLKYKLNWLGGKVLEVPAHYTSQKCCICNHVAQDNRKTQSKFLCINCGHKENADINAAKNILAAGLAVLACGEEALATSVKQEPLDMGDLVLA